MIIKRFTRSVFSVVLLLVGIRTAHAQQLFGYKFNPPSVTATDLVPLPTFGILPVSATGAVTPLDPDVATELTEAVQRQLDAAQSTQFEVVTRPTTGGKINWAFLVKNASRATFDTLTQQFTDQLLTCLHSLDGNDVNLASLNLLLVASPVDATERAEAIAAGTTMHDNWAANRCATRRNDLAFLDQNRPRLVVASRGMLTESFDPLVYNGQVLLDLIAALKAVYLGDGGFLTTEMLPRLQTLFDAAAHNGLLTITETASITDREQSTFWDWVILAISVKPGLVRSLLENTAAGCVASVAALSNPFQLTRCVTNGKLTLPTLRISGQDYTAVLRVTP